MSIASATTSIWADPNMIGAILGSSIGLFGGINNSVKKFFRRSITF